MDWSSDVCSAELAAHEDHAFAGIVDAVPVTGVRDVAVVADDLPARAEDALHLDRVEIGVAVGPRGKRPAVQRISGERVDGVESVAQRCHESILVIHMYNNMRAARQALTRENAEASRPALSSEKRLVWNECGRPC